MNSLPTISHRLLVAAVATRPGDRRKPEPAPRHTADASTNAITLTLEVLTGAAVRGARAIRRSAV